MEPISNNPIIPQGNFSKETPKKKSKAKELAKEHLTKNTPKAAKSPLKKVKELTKDTESKGIRYTSRYFSHSKLETAPNDEIKPPRKRRARTLSTYEPGKAPLLPPLTEPAREAQAVTEAKAVARKSGAFWECVNRIPDEASGGWLYVFRFRDEFDHYVDDIDLQEQRLQHSANKMKEIYPAVEPSDPEAETALSSEYFEDAEAKNRYIQSLTDAEVKKFINRGVSPGRIPRETIKADVKLEVEDHLKNIKILNELGYKYKWSDSGTYVTLPDLRTLKYNWKKLQQKLPGLADLDVISASGTTNSLSFIRAYILHDGLLSFGKEFVHDHFLHITKVISLILSSYRISQTLSNETKVDKIRIYEESKYQFVKSFNRVYRKIEIAKKQFKEGLIDMPKDDFNRVVQHMEMTLSAIIDILTTSSSISEYQKDNYELYSDLTQINQLMKTTWSDEDSQNAFERIRKKRFDALVANLKKQGLPEEVLKQKIEKLVLEENRQIREIDKKFLPIWGEMIKIEKEFDAARKKWKKTS